MEVGSRAPEAEPEDDGGNEEMAVDDLLELAVILDISNVKKLM